MARDSKILVVLVIYKKTLQECASYQSWLRLEKKGQVQLLIYNNSAEIEIPASNDYWVENASTNGMLAGAYNYAWGVAKEKNIDWLLLLDDDTCVNDAYWHEVTTLVERFEQETEVAMLLPRFLHNGVQMVPYTYNPTYFHEWKKHILSPDTLTHDCLFTFNSGIVLKRRVIDAIGGFSTRYPLDYQDVDYLLRIHRKGGAGYVLEAVLEHDLSVWNYAKYMNPTRYQSIIDAQKQMAHDCGWRNVWSLRIFMLGRVIKWLFVADKRPYVWQTIKNIW